MWLPPLRRGVDCVCGTGQRGVEDAMRALLVSVDCTDRYNAAVRMKVYIFTELRLCF
jgi:hypothetical protein